MNTKFSAFIRQPTTINGIAGIIGTAAAAIAGVLTHDNTIGAAAGVIAGSIVAIAMQDNSAEVKPVQQFITDTVNAAIAGALRQRLPLLLGDVSAILGPLMVQPVVQAAPASALAPVLAPAASAPASGSGALPVA